MILRRQSMASGRYHERDLPITQDDLDRWARGAKIQEVFPHLSADEREFIITGIVQDEWDEIFKEGHVRLDAWWPLYSLQSACDPLIGHDGARPHPRSVERPPL